MDLQLSAMLARAVEDGLVGAALVDRDGKTIAAAGDIAEEGAMPLVALAMYHHKSDALQTRLFGREILAMPFEDRHLTVALAKRQLFVVVLLGAATPGQLARVEELRDDVERTLASDDTNNSPPPPPGGSAAGSGPAPAELSIVDLYGIPMSRNRGKA